MSFTELDELKKQLAELVDSRLCGAEQVSIRSPRPFRAQEGRRDEDVHRLSGAQQAHREE